MHLESNNAFPGKENYHIENITSGNKAKCELRPVYRTFSFAKMEVHITCFQRLVKENDHPAWVLIYQMPSVLPINTPTAL